MRDVVITIDLLGVADCWSPNPQPTASWFCASLADNNNVMLEKPFLTNIPDALDSCPQWLSVCLSDEPSPLQMLPTDMMLLRLVPITKCDVIVLVTALLLNSLLVFHEFLPLIPIYVLLLMMANCSCQHLGIIPRSPSVALQLSFCTP